MEQGGVLYWSELYPSAGILDGTDGRNVIIPASVKYELMEIVFTGLGDKLGFSVSAWEDYDIPWVDLPTLQTCLREARGSNETVQNWLIQALSFVEVAMAEGKDLSVAL